MIIKEPIENNLIRIYSDKGVYIHGGFPEADYAEVIDPADKEREYTETNIPIVQPESEPEPTITLEVLKAQIDAMSRVQRGRTEVTGKTISIAIDLVNPMVAAVTLDVQGTSVAYAYTLTEDALTVSFVESVQAWINWEVRG